MGIIYKTFSDPRVFRDLTLNFLMQNEAVHCLGIGIINTLVERPEVYPRFVLAAFFDEAEGISRVVGVAWVTHPHPLGTSLMPIECLPSLLQFATTVKPLPSGIAAPLEIAEAFTEQWVKAKGCKIQTRFAQGIFELRDLVMPPALPGRMRSVTEADKALLREWCWNFVVDCRMAEGRDQGQGLEYARLALEGKGRYFWEVDGVPVAMAGVQGPTPHGIRVGWVYTPPEHRRKGWASQLVAKLSEAQFAAGREFCFLYTDLDNPTSNKIYQELGYKKVSEPLHYSFGYG